MRFSVIIPAYNSSKTIQRCLDSINNQTYAEEFEVIVVDDQSTDNTEGITKDFKFKDHIAMNYVKNQQNSGPGISRQNGINRAAGDYLIFIDSDDYADPTMLQKISNKIDNTGAEIVYYGHNKIIGSKVIERLPKAYPDKETYMALSWGTLWSFAQAKKLWQELETPAISNAEDIAMVPILISRANKVEIIEECLYNYIYCQSSLSNTYSIKVADNFFKSYTFTYNHLKDEGVDKALEFHGIKTMLYGATLNALKAGGTKKDLKYYWDAFISKYPNWHNNPYLALYPKSKKMFLELVRHQSFLGLYLYKTMHNFLLKNL